MKYMKSGENRQGTGLPYRLLFILMMECEKIF